MGCDHHSCCCCQLAFPPASMMSFQALVCFTLVACAASEEGPPKKIPTLKIAEGVEIPMVGLGTWQYNDTVAEAATTLALSLGYTHIDTAIGYGNQVGIGRALAASPRKRESYFITSKVPGGLSHDEAISNCTTSVKQLGIDYVDLMLVHFPATWGGKGGKAARQEQWKAMEEFQKSGGAKAIGISHYCKQHIDGMVAAATAVYFHWRT